ncbi:hypothetical protein JCM19297_2105 [Nonlabens ulvanivorans]|nr:hypothetical protein JCM19297_2105 [Nonlabens ulvanivorans]
MTVCVMKLPSSKNKFKKKVFSVIRFRESGLIKGILTFLNIYNELL